MALIIFTILCNNHLSISKTFSKLPQRETLWPLSSNSPFSLPLCFVIIFSKDLMDFQTMVCCHQVARKCHGWTRLGIVSKLSKDKYGGNKWKYQWKKIVSLVTVEPGNGYTGVHYIAFQHLYMFEIFHKKNAYNITNVYILYIFKP